jgi:hypothetical protein
MLRRVLILSLLAVGPALFASAAHAGGGGGTLTVIKVVDGPVPAGTQFVINVHCTGPGNNTFSTDLTYGESGGTQSMTADRSTPCAVAETTDGGAATVAYACEAVSLSNTPTTCASDQSVLFEDGDATVTVTNTFVAEETQPDADAQAGDVVAATPTFTG